MINLLLMMRCGNEVSSSLEVAASAFAVCMIADRVGRLEKMLYRYSIDPPAAGGGKLAAKRSVFRSRFPSILLRGHLITSPFCTIDSTHEDLPATAWCTAS